MTAIRIPCPTCAGTGNHTLGGGRNNRMDDCATCGATGQIEAQPGSSWATSANPQTGEANATSAGQGEPVVILYRNWRDETAVRRVVVVRWWFGSTQWHPEPQWLLTADEPGTGKRRDFAQAGILAWGGEAVDAALSAMLPRPTHVTHTVRMARQEQMRAWVTRNWSAAAMAPNERVERLIEEVCELAQFEAVAVERVAHIAGKVYQKPVADDPAQEIGGISTCLLAYCAARGWSVDDCEARELARILALPAEHFRKRHAAKVAAGMADAFDSAGEA